MLFLAPLSPSTPCARLRQFWLVSFPDSSTRSSRFNRAGRLRQGCCLLFFDCIVVQAGCCARARGILIRRLVGLVVEEAFALYKPLNPKPYPQTLKTPRPHHLESRAFFAVETQPGNLRAYGSAGSTLGYF